MMSYGLSAESNRAKPSCGLAVMTKYFWPPSLTALTQRWASNSVGLKRGGSFSYSLIGIVSCSMTHSPLPTSEETPQWMNRPNFASSSQRWAVARPPRPPGRRVRHAQQGAERCEEGNENHSQAPSGGHGRHSRFNGVNRLRTPPRWSFPHFGSSLRGQSTSERGGPPAGRTARGSAKLDCPSVAEPSPRQGMQAMRSSARRSRTSRVIWQRARGGGGSPRRRRPAAR